MGLYLKHILWLDLEMTGLDPKSDRIIEVAAIVTNAKLEEIDSYHAVIKQPQSCLENMDEWNKKTHTQTGLIGRVPDGKQESKVEQELISFIKKYFQNDPVILAGSSIHHDRNFIKTHFVELEKVLHYRMLDVTSWKLVFKHLFDVDFKKKNLHKSMDDIKESIEELKFYMDKVVH